MAWAGATFLAPFAIFSMGAVGSLLVQQGANDVNASVRAFGYFVVLLNILAFFSPFVLLVLFRNLYGRQQVERFISTSDAATVMAIAALAR